MLNVDYKILSKIIANRIKKCMHSVIHHSQTAYIKGRSIGDNIRLIDDILSYTEEEDVSGILLSIDFEKAFDSLSWDFLFEALKTFGFGPSLLNWVNLLYKDGKSCILNNGFSSPYFNIGRGVRQGDPLSPYLFVLAAEVMAIAIRRKKEIVGIQIDKIKIKISQYADDTTLFLNNVNSLEEALKLLDKYGKISGLKINPSKTEAMWLGAQKNNKTEPFGIKWTKSVKILGIHFSHDKTAREKCNFENIIPSITKIVNMWKQRKLTLFGKIIILKSLLVSKLVYKASVLSIPDHIINSVSHLLHKFLWNGPDKVKRSVVCGEYNTGGLKMVNIRNFVKSLKLSWICKFYSAEGAGWKMVLDNRMKEVGGFSLFLHSNYDKKMLKHLKVSDFYKELFSVFLSDVRQNRNIMKPEILWNNCHILIESKPVFYKPFFDIGIKYVRDLFLKNNPNECFQYWVNKGLNPSFYLIWHSLRRASLSYNYFIPDHDLEEMTPAFSTSSYNGILREVKSISKSKEFYLVLSQKEEPSYPANANKLISEYSLQGIEELSTFYSLPYKIKIENKLKDFQYRILTGIYNTNALLHKKQLRDNSKCTFCLAEVESISHLFFECVAIKMFSMDLQRYLSEKFEKHSCLEKKDVILGNPLLSNMINFILFLGKHFIHQSRLSCYNPTIDAFILLLKTKYNIEKQSYESKQNGGLFLKRWSFTP